MIALLLEWVSIFCLATGIFLLLSGGVGLLRFPDMFSRMHAAGVTETLAASLVLVGLMLLAGWGIVMFKLLLILVFILITSPTASHALAKSAVHGGLVVDPSRDETS